MEKCTRHVFRSFAARSLKANKTRTIVTVIGIILSMALFTAVIEGAYSGIRFLIDSETEAEGKWIGGFYEINDSQMEQLIRSGEIDESACMERVGWAAIDSKYESKPYMLVESIGPRFEEMVAVHMLEGRLPENNNEIIIPDHLAAKGGLNYKIGDKITLELGERYVDGIPESLETEFMASEDEKIINAKVHEYTVVGIYSRFKQQVEPFTCSDFMALTRGNVEETESESIGAITLFYTMKNVRNYYSFVDNQTIEPTKFVTHSDLLHYYGVSGNNGIMEMITGLVILLVLLILIGSISLIYNSFSISVNERTKQFGILKSIGATKKQLRGAVYFEALILSAFGIVIGAGIGCAGIGLTLYGLSDSFTSLLTFGGSVRMRLVINPIGILIAAAICLITVLISAWIPARRAMKIPTIDAIRQTQDIKIKGKKVKTSKLTQKLFGIEGTLAAKNFKRNKKKCRSVVLSLTMSIILFISASSFCAYLMDSIDNFSAFDQGYDLNVTAYYPWEDEDVMIKELGAIKDVDSILYTRWLMSHCAYNKDILTDESLVFADVTEDNSQSSMFETCIYFLDDASFRQLCADNGQDPDKYFDPGAPLALLQNRFAFYSYDGEKGYTRYYDGDLIKKDCKNIETTFTQYKHVDEKDIDGEYVPEIISSNVLKADAIIDNPGYYIMRNVPTFVYPYSMMDVVIHEGTEEESLLQAPSYYIRTNDHTGVAEAVKQYGEAHNIGLDVFDALEAYETVRMLSMIISVFAYGFIILISLIAVANVFNTISTNVGLRRREFAMLKSMGLSNKGFRKMMNYECMIYGFRGILWGLPISIAITYFMYRAVGISMEMSFYIPWYSLVIAVGSVFLVVFLAMWYSASKIKKDNTIDALKNENL